MARKHPIPKSSGRAKQVARAVTGKDHFPGHAFDKRSPEREQAFLDVLTQGYSITKACAAADINRMTALRWRRLSEAELEGLDPDNPEHMPKIAANFAFRWEVALEAGNETIEDEAVRRAVKGVSKPVYQSGELVGHVQEYSDTLMQIMLKGRNPQRYGVDRKEISGPNGQPIPAGVEIEFVTPKGVGSKKDTGK